MKPGACREIEERHGFAGAPRASGGWGIEERPGSSRARRTFGGVWGAISGPPIFLEEAELRRLRRVVHIGDEPVLLGEAAEALPGLEHFRLVVLHVLVRTGGVPQARQLRRLVDRDARRNRRSDRRAGPGGRSPRPARRRRPRAAGRP